MKTQMKLKNLITITLMLLLCGVSFGQGTVNGEKNGNGSIKKWHRIEVVLDGPNLSEAPATFRNYRLDVTFTSPSNQTFTVPGFFDGDDDPANSGASSGNVWKARFAAGEEGTWTYSVSFVTGTDVAADLSGGRGGTAPDGQSGSFTVGAQDKSGKDFRAKGKLEYVGGHYLEFADGDSFIKCGANSAEVLMGDEDFDGDSSVRNSTGNVNHSFQESDWNNGDPTWGNNRGRGIVGVVNYLSEQGVNAHYFLSMNILGDGKHTFPFVNEDSPYTYDTSKLGQWELVFTQFDKMGLMVHFQTQETENMQYFEDLEGGTRSTSFSVARKIYYRELVARFGHHMAITWNVGEENNSNSNGSQDQNTPAQRRMFAERLDDLAPYNDNIVIHDGAGQNNAIDIYQTGGLLGNTSYTGTSLQLFFDDNNHDIIRFWYDESESAGKEWVITYDETFARSNSRDLTTLRKDAIWSTLMAGGHIAWYIAGNDTNTNLDYSDFEDQFQTLGRAATFMNDNLADDIQNMDPDDDLIDGNDNYAMANPDNTYLFYLRDGGNATVDLSDSSGSAFTVLWYNPSSGATTNRSNVNGGSSNTNLGNPPNNTNSDWVVLLKSTSATSNEAPLVSFNSPEEGTTLTAPASLVVDVAASDSDGSIDSVDLFLNNTFIRTEGGAPYLWNDSDQDDALSDLANGTYTLRAEATDNDGATTTVSQTFTVGSATNTPPTVSFTTPTDGTVLTAPGSLEVLVAASDNDGSIASVSLFLNNALVSTDSTAPYSFDDSALSDLAVGTYTLRAVATDDGDATTSVSRTFTVAGTTTGTPPMVSFTLPASGTVVSSPGSLEVEIAASDSDGSIASVDLFINDTFIRTEGRLPYLWNDTDQDDALSNLVNGTYTLRAVATDNDGETTSVTTNFTVGSSTGPTVTFTLPTAETILVSPADVEVAVNASDADGSIASVSLFLDDILVRTEGRAPFVWNDNDQDDALSNLTDGTYTLRVVATDNDGNTTTEERNFTVTPGNTTPPTVSFTLPTSGTILSAPASLEVDVAASDADGSITSVDLFLNDVYIRTEKVNPYLWNNSGQDDELSNLSSGTYTLRAVATDNDGNTFATERTFTVGSSGASGNLALNGFASQSSTAFNGEASRAIDGNTNGNYNDDSVTHTDSEANAWWEVDLGSTYSIGDINIFNRTNNCCINRLTNFTVSVIGANGTTTFSQSFNSVPNPSITVNAGNAIGTTVRVELNETDTPLSLAEVEVFGFVSLDVSSDIRIVSDTSSYPNPFVNSLTVEVDDDLEIYSVQISGTSGNLINTPATIEGNQAKFSTEMLGTGMYFIRLDTSQGIKFQKVIKE